LRTNTGGNLGTLAFLNSGFRGGGLDLEAFEDVLEGLGLNPLAVGQGQGTTVAVIDISAFVEHEDLVNRVNPEPGQTPVLIQQNPIDPDHGTAVLGVIGAEDNGFGITGIASGAQLNFYPSVSIEEGERLLAALTQALIDLDEGDVICLPIGFNGNAAVSSPSVNFLVRLGTDAGIATVCSAGNAGIGINPGPIDSGAIIVTACWPGYRLGAAPLFQPQPDGLAGLNYCRYQQSNYEPLEPIPGIDQAAAVSGWEVPQATQTGSEPWNCV
jgi:subtilisin family serine protease